MAKKRTDYLSWDEYFMGVANLTGQRSKDPSTQVGACIVSPENKIVGVGYTDQSRAARRLRKKERKSTTHK